MRNFLTSTQVLVLIVGIVPVHLELIVVPVGVWHVAIGIARAVILSYFFHITRNLLQNSLSFLVVKQA
jgi:hypothetical protein